MGLEGRKANGNGSRKPRMLREPRGIREGFTEEGTSYRDLRLRCCPDERDGGVL